MSDQNQETSGFWMAYGGYRALLTSPFFHFSLIFSLVFFFFGLRENWVGYAQDFFPDLLGFTLGGFAIFVSFGNEKFVSILTGSDDDGKPSPLLSISASFAYFIFCQIIALIYSMAFEFLPNVFSSIPEFPKSKLFFYYVEIIFSFIGAFFTVYALSLAIAATHSIFRLVCLFDLFDSNKPN
ncbi:hypothetical protein [Marinobacter sp. P4B1]|uniref:hypothetical protein n=1 Tax=Marinobacter sp. P4B1 TaxID=1119533 RepID=UPI00071D92E7|nr:hypothetical protein [Marinobacter sp. P4B1]KRW80858.1 hypothetical protein AQ621_01520 [Marinobacter sp. P4B1]|tara:strand:+ start:995 stop:1540 length:546 start_codon:yes stop_codon:yes gene_type:complete